MLAAKIVQCHFQTVTLNRIIPLGKKAKLGPGGSDKYIICECTIQQL